MLGSLIGDIAGSVHEFAENKDPGVELFPADAQVTDDSILTLATAEALLSGQGYAEVYQAFGRAHPHPMGGYGNRFRLWLEEDDPQPYHSWGNGSAMRVGPVGWAHDTVEAVLDEAARSAAVSHDHPEGIKGAQAVALVTLLARQGVPKPDIRTAITTRFGYDLDHTVAEVRASYTFNESCQGTVPEALIAFLEAQNFEQAVRNAISLGGDADTVACITGGVAEAFFGGVPEAMAREALNRLPDGLRPTLDRFRERYMGQAR